MKIDITETTDKAIRRMYASRHEQQRAAAPPPAPPAPSSYCGGWTRYGHGENAVCGQPFYDGIYQCQHCKLRLAEAEISSLKAQLAARAA